MTKTLADHTRIGTDPTRVATDALSLADAARTARRLAVTLRQIQRHTTVPRWRDEAATADRQARLLETLSGSTQQPVLVPTGRNIVALLLDARLAIDQIDVLPKLAGSYRTAVVDRIWRNSSEFASIRMKIDDWLCDLDAHPTKEASDIAHRNWRAMHATHPR